MKTSNRYSYRPAAVVLPLLLLLLLTVGAVTARADGYTRTLSAETAVPGYVDYDATLYDFQTNTPAVLPTTGDLRYRDGGNWGLHNFGSGTRSAIVTIPVREGNILVLQHYSNNIYATLNRGTLNEELSSETGYQCYDITETASDITITIARYGGIVAAVVLNNEYSYTVNASCGSATVQVGTGVSEKGSTVSVPFPRYINVGGTLYLKGAVSSQFKHSFTLSSDNQVETLTYDATTISNVQYLTEAEDVMTRTEISGNNTRSSMAAAGYTATPFYTPASFPVGAYRIGAAAYANDKTTFVFRSGDAEVLSHTGSGYWQTFGESTTFQTTAQQPVSVTGGSQNYGLDYFYVQTVFAYKDGSSNRSYSDTNKKPTLIAPAGATITYESSNTAVATVDADGIDMHHNGTAVITARTTIDGVEYYTQHTVTVTGEPEATATFTPDSPDTYETLTVSGTGYLPETLSGNWLTVDIGNPQETQQVDPAGALYGIDSNGFSFVYAPAGIPIMGTFFAFTPTKGVNGTLSVYGLMTAANGLRLTDAEGNVLEKISASAVTANSWQTFSFSTLLMGGVTYYVFAETGVTGHPAGDDTTTPDTDAYPVLYLNSATLTKMSGTTINLIDQSLLFYPEQNANLYRMDRDIPGFSLTFEGKSGISYRSGNFLVKNGKESTDEENGKITIKPRKKAGASGAFNFRSVKLNIGSKAQNSPTVTINGDGGHTVTANSMLTVGSLSGEELVIKLTSTGTKDYYQFLLNSITITYDADDGLLDDSKGAIDLRMANDYLYGHSGDEVANAVHFENPHGFYGDVTFTYSGDEGFANANSNTPAKSLENSRLTYYRDGSDEYKVRIGQGVGLLTATFAETDYFAEATATTRLYSYDYTETPNLVLAPGESYTVPAGSDLYFALTATGGGTVSLTNVEMTTYSADGTRLLTRTTGDGGVTITNTGSTTVTLTQIEVFREQPELDFSYPDMVGNDGNVIFAGESLLPSAFTITSGATDYSSYYETSGTYTVARALQGITVDPATGKVTAAADADQGVYAVTLTVNPTDAYKNLYAPVSKTLTLLAVNGLWDFRTYKYYNHQQLWNSDGWSGTYTAYNLLRDTESYEYFIQRDGEPLPQAVALKSSYKMRMTWAKNNGDGRLHLFGKGSNEQNKALYGHGGILRVPVKKGMEIEINAYSNGEQSEMYLDGCNDLLNASAVTEFYVDETSASQYFIAARDGYIDIINPSSNLDLYVNYIRLTSNMVFYYGNETYTEPGGTFNNYVINQGETTLSYEKTADTGSGSDAICQSISADGTVTQRVGAYGSYEVTVTGSGSGLLAGKTGTYTVHVIGFSVNTPVERQIDATGVTTFTPKDDITITNSSGLDEEELKKKVVYTMMSQEVSVAYFDGDNLVVEGTGDVVLMASLGAITRTMAYRVHGASLNDPAPVITNTTGSYTVVIRGGSGSYAFDTDKMTAGILGDLAGTTPTYTQEDNRLTISGLPSGVGGIIPIYASCADGDDTVTLEGVLTVAYSSHVWNFESDLVPTLSKWLPKDAGSWSDACTFEEPVDASAGDPDTKDWCFVRKMGVTHPESSIIYYYNYSVVGTNALVIPETEGLYLRTTHSGKQLGVEMDNERIDNVGVPKLTDGKYACRNLMILRGGQVVIPKVKPGQWIEVRWTRHQDDMAERLSMQNLCDVDGKYINEIYKIGNCFYNIPGQTSTYMFQVNPDATPDMLDSNGCLDAVFEVADNIYISIQQIELHEPGWDYTSSMAQRLQAYADGNEEEAVDVAYQYVTDGTEHTLVFLPKDAQNAPNAPQVWTIGTDGDLSADTGFSKSDGDDATASITWRDGWGKVYVTLTSYSQNMKYVANRCTWVITIGARPQQTYPYTWDFTKYFTDTKSNVGGTDDDYYVEDPNYSDAPVCDKATDMTSYITNPTIDGNANGWTISRNYGNGPVKPSNDALEYWLWTDYRNDGSFDYYQTLSVPNGYYIVSADMYNSINNEEGAIFKPTVCLYANNGSFDERVAVDEEGTDFNTYSTAAIKVTDGTLRIGVKNFDNMAARWFVADNFRLTRIEYDSPSTRAHEYRRVVDTWTESGTTETALTDGYDSRKYTSFYVDGAQLVSRTLGLLPETEGLGFAVADKSTAGQLSLNMQSTTDGGRGTSGTNTTWRDGSLTLAAGSSITVPTPGDDFSDYYIYIRCDRAPSSVTNAERVSDDVDDSQQQYKYHFMANADAVIHFDSETVVYVLGVTNIFKPMHKVGGKGWATESRSHDIDHALTGHLTTNDANAFTVDFDSYDLQTATVRLTAVDENGYVPTGDGVVMMQELSTAGTDMYAVPLFYPAITTGQSSAETEFSSTGNLMKANLTATLHDSETEGDYTKFLLTNIHWTYDTEHTLNTDEAAAYKVADAAGFYRMHVWETTADATERNTMAANLAYLCVPTSSLPTAVWDLQSIDGLPSRRFSIGIRDNDADISDEDSSDAESGLGEGDEAGEWFTLDGMRIDGSPRKPGLYIRNGRKVLVKGRF